MILSKQTKSKIYLLFFSIVSGIIAWNAWTNYKPQVIKASCADIASRTGNIHKRNTIVNDVDAIYDQALEECLLDAGYYH